MAPATRLPWVALAVLVGDLLAQCLPALVPPIVLGVGAVALAVCCWRWPRLLPLWFVCAGFFWTDWRADMALEARMPAELAGQDFVVTGRIAGLPEWRGGVARFRLQVAHAQLDGHPVALDGGLRLAWYGRAGRAVGPCQRWRLRVRLKPPHAMLNPGGFDGERHALQRRTVAVGYVRDEGLNQRLDSNALCIDGVRAAVSAAIASRVADQTIAPLLQALAVGDTRGLGDQHWQVARVTGVSHLLAISGFHIGVVALFGAWLAGGLWRLLAWRTRGPPRQTWEAVAALATALVYSLLAGMGLPTRRTLVMIAVVCLARLARRSGHPVGGLALALLAVLVIDPLAVLAPGMWLSFMGVAFLMFGMTRDSGWSSGAMELGRAQLLMTVALLPLTVSFFGQAAVVGPVANLVAVPVVSLLVVPLVLAGSLLWPLAPPLAGWLWHVDTGLMALLWRLLQWLAAWPAAHVFLPDGSWFALPLAIVGSVWLLTPRGLPARWLGLLLFLPLLLPALDLPGQGAFRATVVDVGQGLSVLVRTREHALLYDAGPRYPSGFDVGKAVVVPAMRALGVRDLDLLMISHGDNDHAGGAAAVLQAWPEAAVRGSDTERSGVPLLPCRHGRHWRWDGVAFRVLHPDEAWPGGSNDGSCVLLVTGPGGRLLLTGDISSLIEPLMARRTGSGPPLVLVVPHHGSKSSSRASFLARLAPVMALNSAGWHSRFGHPAPAVLARYRAAGIPFYNTAQAGAIRVDFPADGPPRLRQRIRCDVHRYWRPAACAMPPKALDNAAIMRTSMNASE